MKPDFDAVLDRAGTNAVKWEYVQDDDRRIAPTDIFLGEDRTLPMWVADMDFPSPQPVIDALVARAEHGVYGYTARSAAYLQAVVDWMQARHGWGIQPEWITPSPGIVAALHMLVRTFVSPGEKVLIQPPVYHPFYFAIENNQAEIARNPLRYERHSYTMDFDDLEATARDPLTKLAILCHPHNPVGRVWSQEELKRFAEICLDNDVLVVSDEVHSDLLYPGVTFTPYATLGDDYAQQAVICTAASKTFNLAGMHTSNIIIPNPELRARFEDTLNSNGLFGGNIFGTVALEAAYRYGADWLAELLAYLQANLDFLQTYLSEHLPQIKLVKPEGTYLVWLDCRGLGLDKEGLEQLMREEAKVYMDEGYIFGPEGDGFERMNIACPRAILAEALDRIKAAVDNL